MAVNALPLSLEPDYPSMFRHYVIKSTKLTLANIRQAGAKLPHEELEQALLTLNYSLKLPQAWPDTRALLVTMAPKMEQVGYRDEWISYLEQAIDQSRQLSDLETTAELSLRLGILYRLRGKYEQARACDEKSARDFQALNDAFNQARALNELAHVARLQHQFDEATGLIEAALDLLNESESERAYSYLILALTAFDKRAFQDAINFCKQALNWWELQPNQLMIGRTLTILGTALEKMKRYPEALDACQQAIACFEEIQDIIYLPVALMNLGNVYLRLKQPLEALDLYLAARQMLRKSQDMHHLGMVNHNLGMVYHQLQEWPKAEEAYLLSIKQEQEVPNIPLLINAFDGLGLVYLAQGRFKQAKTAFEEALNVLPLIKDDASHKYLFEMVTSHLQDAFSQLDQQKG